jgi:hypothetical protein
MCPSEKENDGGFFAFVLWIINPSHTTINHKCRVFDTALVLSLIPKPYFDRMIG